MGVDFKRAIRFIERHGIILVFPNNNRREPPSLWYQFFPRTEMRWEWDETGQDGVAALWHLRTELSVSSRVVYTKWYRGRATFFSKSVFTAMLTLLRSSSSTRTGLGEDASRILEILRSDSPLSTKVIKQLSDLQGRFHEASYQRAMKELWNRLFIVAFGEVEDSSFPSLAVGATDLLFEELWDESRRLSPAKAEEIISKTLPAKSPFMKYFSGIRKGLEL
ncbi:MAG TPA: hypothetical protein VJB59_02475 [Bdellovibrionota bacterium]|nr:hypothetical protein [Bdellovibrionota bacterium]